MRNKITLCLAYYENPGMLLRQLDLIAALSPQLQVAIEMIVVDDGSPTRPAEPVVSKWREWSSSERLQLFRMDVDVPWNMDACRNLAVSQARTPWVLLTDIDHLVPEKTWRNILSMNLNPRAGYKFSRVSEPEMAVYKPHPNSWLMHRELYDAAGGYDERLAGWYGTDGDMRNRIVSIATVVQLKDPIIRVPREVTPDASTTTLVRRSPENSAGLDKAKRDRDQIKNWRPLRNTFPWHRVL